MTSKKQSAEEWLDDNRIKTIKRTGVFKEDFELKVVSFSDAKKALKMARAEGKEEAYEEVFREIDKEIIPAPLGGNVISKIDYLSVKARFLKEKEEKK